MNLVQVKNNLRKFSSQKQARILQRFFKTAPGEYAQGDIFLGVKVPVIRHLAKQCQEIKFKEVLQLLKSPLHEERLLALLIFILKFRQANSKGKKIIYQAYLKHSRYINNWDLVDLSAGHILGAFLADKDRGVLYKLASSSGLWKKRIAIVSTSYFIKNNDFKDTLKIAKILIFDRHDLIHKAVGWMLREVGKRDLALEEKFLNKYCHRMPRTMLRYAIERFPESNRQVYLRWKLGKSF